MTTAVRLKATTRTAKYGGLRLHRTRYDVDIDSINKGEDKMRDRVRSSNQKRHHNTSSGNLDPHELTLLCGEPKLETRCLAGGSLHSLVS